MKETRLENNNVTNSEEEITNLRTRIDDIDDRILDLIGRRLAAAGEFTEYHHLLPIYTRRPEAVRLWETRRGSGGPRGV